MKKIPYLALFVFVFAGITPITLAQDILNKELSWYNATQVKNVLKKITATKDPSFKPIDKKSELDPDTTYTHAYTYKNFKIWIELDNQEKVNSWLIWHEPVDPNLRNLKIKPQLYVAFKDTTNGGFPKIVWVCLPQYNVHIIWSPENRSNFDHDTESKCKTTVSKIETLFLDAFTM